MLMKKQPIQPLKSTNPLTNNPVFNSFKPVDLRNFTKDEMKAYFNNSYDLYETLFSSIKNDLIYYLCPDRLRLPLIFYYGHTAAVFINKLVLSGLLKPNERVNADLETNFETGVDEMSWDDIEHYRMGGDCKWPTVEDTKNYRLKVRKLINDLIDKTPLELPVTMDSPWWAIIMGIEHEHIHFETSTVLIRQFPIDMVTRPNGWIYGPTRSNKVIDWSQNSMIEVEESKVRIGKKYEFPSFGWDNEYAEPVLECIVSPFEASKFKITNEQFLEFVISGGYQNRDYWSEEGWQWIQFKEAKHPLFWVCPMGCKSGCGGAISSYSHCKSAHFTDDELKLFPEAKNNDKNKRIHNLNKNTSSSFGYKLRLMFDVISMPMNWPVEVNYHEAKAFCKWKGDDYRVLSEAEHYAIRDHIINDLNPMNDVIFKRNTKINHNMLFGSSTPVDLNPSNKKGFNDVFGNVWEWTEDHFNALPGNKTHFLYDDFSTPCYDGRHNVIMGGSWASTGDVASYFARYMFRRHFFQHCGFRLVRSLPTNTFIKPNPQIRLISDRIYLLGGSTPDNQVNLNASKLTLNYYQTMNKQYLFDSHLNQDLFENELLYEFDESSSLWFKPLLNEIDASLNDQNVKKRIATHLGASTGRITFELTKTFDEVVGIDFSSKLLESAIKLQSCGNLETKLETKNNKIIKLDIRSNLSAAKAIFKQMTWLPNEVPKSDFVLFTMIDRVTNHLSWIKRFREIVNFNGLAIIYSKESKWTSRNLMPDLHEDFELVKEVSLCAHDTLTIWKMKKDYESL